MATKKTAKSTQSSPPAKAAKPKARTAKSVKSSAGTAGESTADGKRISKPKAATQSTLGSKPRTAADETSPAAILSRAEEDMGRLLESLNAQMNAAMHAFEELAALQRGGQEPIIRPKPIDRATAMFQRLISEVMDERMGELLPILVALRAEMDQRARSESNGEQTIHGEFLARGTEMLDQVLANAEVQAYRPKVGDAFDPLIHLAVGETHQPDLPDGVVAEAFQEGYRTVRGKVIHAARVKVNRR